MLNKVLTSNEHFSGKELDLSFAQEWPLGGQTWQGAYAFSSDRELDEVWLDLQLRFQVLDLENDIALAPYVKVSLPVKELEPIYKTDGERVGIGLPISSAFSDNTTIHLNFAMDYFRVGPKLRLTGPAVVIPYGDDAWAPSIGGSVVQSLSPRSDVLVEATYSTEMIEEVRVRKEATEAVISPGFRHAWNFTSGAQMVGGFGLPIGLTDDVPEVSGLFYLSFEHSFLR